MRRRHWGGAQWAPSVVLVGALALALSEAHARAGWWPPERPAMSVEGPWNTRWSLETSDRLRGEFVDYFKANPGLKKPDFRYDFLANRFQGGIRIRRDPWEAFFQFQHTVLDDIPSGAPPGAPGGVYFANGVAMTYATDDGADQAVADVVSSDDGVRTYLYTKFELVSAILNGIVAAKPSAV